VIKNAFGLEEGISIWVILEVVLVWALQALQASKLDMLFLQAGTFGPVIKNESGLEEGIRI